jgi:hypothetical protein
VQEALLEAVEAERRRYEELKAELQVGGAAWPAGHAPPAGLMKQAGTARTRRFTHLC